MLPLGNVKQFQILERTGFKFGLIGLVKEEWLVTLAAISEKDVIITDYVLQGRVISGKHVIKSRTDFREFSVIDLKPTFSLSST